MLKGFEASSDIRFAGRQTDLILESKEEHVGRIIVECKFHMPHSRARVSVPQVEAFAARVLRLRNSGDANVGYLVTNTDFTADAKGALVGRPEKQFVFLRTISELRRKIVDFTPYLARQIRTYEEEDAFATYEELNGIQSNTRNKVGLMPALQEFVNSTKDSTIAILLGDYGSGKTTTARRLAYVLAKRALAEGYTGRIPCLIPLRYFSYTGTASAMILEFLSKDVGVRGVTYDAFHEMNRAGLLFLILDGFDEMAKRVTRQVREESFRALGDLLTPQSKMIITGRPGYFPADRDLVNAIATVRSPSSLAAMRRVLHQRRSTSSSDILLFAISPLDAHQIKSFLHKKLNSAFGTNKKVTVKAIAARIKSIYKLAELAQRPILLEMIAETFTRKRQREISGAVHLYAAYTSLWLDIDMAKGQFRTLVSPQFRLDFALCLAWQMYERESDTIHFTDLSEIVAAHFALDEPEDVDHFSSDVRTCSFLHRDDKGYYSFSHRSFFEYFLAKYLVEVKKRKLPVLNPFYSTVVTINHLFEQVPNVFHFLSPMLGYPVDPAFWKQIAEHMEAKTDALHVEPEAEHQWYLMVSNLAEGKAALESLSAFEPKVYQTYQTLISLAQQCNTVSRSDPWRKRVVELVTKQQRLLGIDRR